MLKQAYINYKTDLIGLFSEVFPGPSLNDAGVISVTLLMCIWEFLILYEYIRFIVAG